MATRHSHYASVPLFMVHSAALPLKLCISSSSCQWRGQGRGYEQSCEMVRKSMTAPCSNLQSRLALTGGRQSILNRQFMSTWLKDAMCFCFRCKQTNYPGLSPVFCEYFVISWVSCSDSVVWEAMAKLKRRLLRSSYVSQWIAWLLATWYQLDSYGFLVDS